MLCFVVPPTAPSATGREPITRRRMAFTTGAKESPATACVPGALIKFRWSCMLPPECSFRGQRLRCRQRSCAGKACLRVTENARPRLYGSTPNLHAITLQRATAERGTSRFTWCAGSRARFPLRRSVVFLPMLTLGIGVGASRGQSPHGLQLMWAHLSHTKPDLVAVVPFKTFCRARPLGTSAAAPAGCRVGGIAVVGTQVRKPAT